MRRKFCNDFLFPVLSMMNYHQDGLFFLQLMKWGVLQYCVIRPTCAISHTICFLLNLDIFDGRTTLAAVILNHIGLYCETSWSPAWGHIYVCDASLLIPLY